MSTFIDELSHIQSRVRDGEKWEYKSQVTGVWRLAIKQTVEYLNQLVKEGYEVRLASPCTCAVEETKP